MRIVAAISVLLAATPCLAVYETDGVQLRGFAYPPATPTHPTSNIGAVRITFRLQTVYGDADETTSGVFDCRAPASLAGTCPSSSSGSVLASFGYSDVKGDVSTATFNVSFADGTTCEFDGLTPLPMNDAPKFLHFRASLVLVAGIYTCHNANAATTAQGNFFTTGSRLAIPKCKDGNRVLCSPI